MRELPSIIKLCQKMDANGTPEHSDRLMQILKNKGVSADGNYKYILVDTSSDRIGYGDSQFIGSIILFKLSNGFYQATKDENDWREFIEIVTGINFPGNISAAISTLASDKDVKIWNDPNNVPGGLRRNFPLGTIEKEEKSPGLGPAVNPPESSPNDAASEASEKSVITGALYKNCWDLVKNNRVDDNVKRELEQLANQVLSQPISGAIYKDQLSRGQKALRIIKNMFPDKNKRILLYVAATCKQHLFSSHPRYINFGKTTENELFMDKDGKIINTATREKFLTFLEDLYVALKQLGAKNPKGPKWKSNPTPADTRKISKETTTVIPSKVTKNPSYTELGETENNLGIPAYTPSNFPR